MLRYEEKEPHIQVKRSSFLSFPFPPSFDSKLSPPSNPNLQIESDKKISATHG